jgi:hypothetical protein
MDSRSFQAFGCVLGFDWHSLGVTTVVTGVLKQAIRADIYGISIAGGKGKKSTTAKNDIPNSMYGGGYKVIQGHLIYGTRQMSYDKQITWEL